MRITSDKLSLSYVSQKVWESYLRVGANPPDSLFRIPGYLHPLEGRLLYWLAGRVPEGGTAVEIGSFKGKSSSFLAAGLVANARLYCVDTWQCDAMPYDNREDVFDIFKKHTSPYASRIVPRRGISEEVAANWQDPVDLLFIDGDHSYEGCLTDIRAWLGHVKSGGWVAFHDSREKGVVRAIDEMFPKEQQGIELRAWSILVIQKK